MKKKIVFILFFFIWFYIQAEESQFIDIESAEAIIGNDLFKAKKKTFTGVAGEENDNVIKYYRKEHNVKLSKYSIEKYLVTNEEFQKFLKQTKYKTLFEKKSPYDYKKRQIVYDQPVTGISFIDAIAYCQWYSDKKGEVYRLPTSAEWEYAALANTKRIFPWGDEAKILPSTNTELKVGRNIFSVYAIEEDVSPLGMSNLMGGLEYTLDCYDEFFYENSPLENPVCLIPYNAQCVMRGIRDYNNLDSNVYGLYDLNWNAIDDYYGYSYFRMVKADDTVFNKGTIDEACYCSLIGRASSVTVYEHPIEAGQKEKYEVSSKLYILFKSIDSSFYRCIFQVKEKSIFGNIVPVWKIGWISENDISLTEEKWY